MFENVDGMEVFVNPERVIWVREYPGQITVSSAAETRTSLRYASVLLKPLQH